MTKSLAAGEGALLNDFILQLADHGLFRPLWSMDLLFELRKNLVATHHQFAERDRKP